MTRDLGGSEIEPRLGNPSVHLSNLDCRMNMEKKLLLVPDQCLKMKVEEIFVVKQRNLRHKVKGEDPGQLLGLRVAPEHYVLTILAV